MQHLFIKICVTIAMLLPLSLAAQNGFSLSTGAGVSYNYFVDRASYNEAPDGVSSLRILNKNPIGHNLSLKGAYRFGKNEIKFGYAYSQFSRSRNIDYLSADGSTRFVVRDFKFRHTNHIFDLTYSRTIAPGLSIMGGVFSYRKEQQEVDVIGRSILVEERNFSNSKLEDGGFLAGLEYSTTLTGKMDIGGRFTAYYAASLGRMEELQLGPFLRYNF